MRTAWWWLRDRGDRERESVRPGRVEDLAAPGARDALPPPAPTPAPRAVPRRSRDGGTQRTD